MTDGVVMQCAIIPCVFGFYCLCFMMHRFMLDSPFKALKISSRV